MKPVVLAKLVKQVMKPVKPVKEMKPVMIAVEAVMPEKASHSEGLYIMMAVQTPVIIAK